MCDQQYWAFGQGLVVAMQWKPRRDLPIIIQDSIGNLHATCYVSRSSRMTKSNNSTEGAANVVCDKGQGQGGQGAGGEGGE